MNDIEIEFELICSGAGEDGHRPGGRGQEDRAGGECRQGTIDIVGKMVKFLALLPAKFNIPSPSLFSWSHGHEAPTAQSWGLEHFKGPNVFML